jgi:hypothetical protein
MGIALSHDTAPHEAIKLGYEFGKKLRTWGFVPEQFASARRVWVDRPHGGHNLLSHLRVGFTAGYWGRPIPKDKQPPKAPPQSFANAG